MGKVNRWQEWDNSAPTDVDKWLALYAEDDNTFWATDFGHIMNVVDELIERLSTARADEREKERTAAVERIKAERDAFAQRCIANRLVLDKEIYAVFNDCAHAAARGDGAE